MASLLRERPPAVVPFDCHCHLLPGLDDGARDLDESVAMARSLVATGVREVLASPHVSSDEYRNSRQVIAERAAQVQAAVQAAGLPLVVLAGAEYLVEPALLDRAGGEGLLCFGGARNVLVELPRQPRLGEAVRALLERLRQSGHTPVLAHPERVEAFQHSPELAARLREEGGVRLQVNYGSFEPAAPAHVRRLATWLWRQGHVDFFGSDMHRLPGRGAR